MYKGQFSRSIIKGGRSNSNIQQFVSTVEKFTKGDEDKEEAEVQIEEPKKEPSYQDYRDISIQRPDSMFPGETRSDEDIAIMQRKLLRDAADKSEKIINFAKAEAEQIKKDAYEEGYNTGHQEGMKDGRRAAQQQAEAEFKQTIEKYQTAVAHSIIQIGEERDESFHRYLDELKNVAIAVAEKVIHISLETSGEIIKRMIIAEVEKMKKTEWIKIYIDKYDYEQLISVDEDVANDLARISDNVKFVVQDKEKIGYAVIETPSEMIDIGVDSQIDNIRENLNGISLSDDEEGNV